MSGGDHAPSGNAAERGTSDGVDQKAPFGRWRPRGAVTPPPHRCTVTGIETPSFPPGRKQPTWRDHRRTTHRGRANPGTEQARSALSARRPCYGRNMYRATEPTSGTASSAASEAVPGRGRIASVVNRKSLDQFRRRCILPLRVAPPRRGGGYAFVVAPSATGASPPSVAPGLPIHNTSRAEVVRRSWSGGADPDGPLPPGVSSRLRPIPEACHSNLPWPAIS